jgi:hypothetical protein
MSGCRSANLPHLLAKLRGPETASPTHAVDGGVRRFERTRLRNPIPVNRVIFRVFRVSPRSREAAIAGKAKREASLRTIAPKNCLLRNREANRE